MVWITAPVDRNRNRRDGRIGPKSESAVGAAEALKACRAGDVAEEVDCLSGVIHEAHDFLGQGANLTLFLSSRRVVRSGWKIIRNNSLMSWSPCSASYGVRDACRYSRRVALALQADGWFLRQDIIWHKPNPMPESVAEGGHGSSRSVRVLARSWPVIWKTAAARKVRQMGR